MSLALLTVEPASAAAVWTLASSAARLDRPCRPAAVSQDAMAAWSPVDPVSQAAPPEESASVAASRVLASPAGSREPQAPVAVSLDATAARFPASPAAWSESPVAVLLAVVTDVSSPASLASQVAWTELPAPAAASLAGTDGLSRAFLVSPVALSVDLSPVLPALAMDAWFRAFLASPALPLEEW